MGRSELRCYYSLFTVLRGLYYKFGKDSGFFINSNFLGIPSELSDWDNARFAVLPVPYDHTTTFQSGTRKGPKAIIEASAYIELYDDELRMEPAESGVHTLDLLDVTVDPGETLDRISNVITDILKAEKIPVMLGGEHSITFGAVKALKDKYSNFSVLQLDAHGDLRKEYQGTELSHACVMRRIAELNIGIVQAGIRSISKEEAEYIQKANNIFTFFAANIIGREDWMEEAVSHLSENVYITIDVDVFDPSYVPATGTPEPGGLDWYQVIRFLNLVSRERKIVGFDAVELCPIPGQVASDFLVAKLLYKLMGYTIR